MTTKTRLILFVLIVLVCAGCQRPGGPPTGQSQESNAVRQYSIEQFLGIHRLSGLSFSADNSKLLFSSDEEGISNAYSIRLDNGKAKHRPHTGERTQGEILGVVP